jgi:hypothetical protein
VNYGIPQSLYHLPLYATECNGMYFWRGGHPEDQSKTYVAGWMQEMYAEINRYNQEAALTGKPIFRCVNLYRWCANCDGWNIDGATNKTQILTDLDAAIAQSYLWPTNMVPTNPPPAPSGLTATVSSALVTLTWTPSLTASGYNVKRSTINGGPYTTIASNVTSTNFSNTFFTPNTTYYYRVSAVNVVGESPNSSQASATPTNGLPDVALTAIKWSPDPVFTGESVLFSGTVTNQGSASSPFINHGIGFTLGDFFAWHGGDRSMAPGTSVTLSVNGSPSGGTLWTATLGTHTMSAHVDDVDRFTEALEGNNILAVPVPVYVRGYNINCGGAAISNFVADSYFTGSTNTFSVATAIVLTNATSAAPEVVYQSERWGECTYSLSNLIPTKDYLVRLHFAEISPSVTAVGHRRFHITINGSQVLTNFDIFAEAGGKFRALTRDYIVSASAPGEIIVQFTKGASNEPKCSGIEILPAPPRFSAITFTNNQARLTWRTFPRKTYQLQFKSSLTNAGWTPLSSNTIASGDTLAFTNNVSGTQQRFYRVVQVD